MHIAPTPRPPPYPSKRPYHRTPPLDAFAIYNAPPTTRSILISALGSLILLYARYGFRYTHHGAARTPFAAPFLHRPISPPRVLYT